MLLQSANLQSQSNEGNILLCSNKLVVNKNTKPYGSVATGLSDGVSHDADSVSLPADTLMSPVSCPRAHSLTSEKLRFYIREVRAFAPDVHGAKRHLFEEYNSTAIRYIYYSRKLFALTITINVQNNTK